MYIIADVKDPKARMDKKFNTDTQQVYYIPMCAFGIRWTCYLQNKGLNSGNNPYDNCVGIVRYKNEYPDVAPFRNKKKKQSS